MHNKIMPKTRKQKDIAKLPVDASTNVITSLATIGTTATSSINDDQSTEENLAPDVVAALKIGTKPKTAVDMDYIPETEQKLYGEEDTATSDFDTGY
jgi:hypothetical protein